MKTIHILHILSRYRGDYPLFDDFVLGLDSSRFRSTVCFLRGGGPDRRRSRLEEEGIEVVFLDPLGRSVRGIRLSCLYRLGKIVRERGVDLIHCQRHKPTVYGVLTSLLSGGRPVVSTVHGTRRTRSGKRRLVNRFLFSRVDRIIAVSGAVKQDILETNPGLREEKVEVVRNGLDYQRILLLSSISKQETRPGFLRGHDGDFWFGTVGRLTPVKNHRRMISAFAEVSRKRPDSILLIAGTGPLKEKLLEWVQRLDLGEKVFLIGHRNDIPEFLRALDAFVFPSLREGLPLALLEAMASGLPSVVSRIEATKELMGGTDCAVYVNPEEEGDLRDGMLALREQDRDVLRAMGERARERALEKFTIQRMSRRIGELYRDLVL